MIADALHFFDADISYFARSEKEGAKLKGYRYLPLDRLLAECEVICCCLNRNTVLIHKEQFEAMGERKILFNTGLSPAWDEEPFLKWLEGDNICYCDTRSEEHTSELQSRPHLVCRLLLEKKNKKKK